MQSPNATYEEINSANVASSQLDGKTLRFIHGSLTMSPPIAEVTGTLQHDTNAIVVGADGQAGQISDADGPDANGQIVDDTNSISASIFGGYDFVRQVGGGFNQWNGYIGVGTVNADMPASGSAVFNDQSFGSTTLSNNLNGNAATVTANFFPTGGTLTVTRDGTVQDVTSYTFYAEGDFYGYDPSYSGPDEVGSIISSIGTDGGVRIVIVAE